MQLLTDARLYASGSGRAVFPLFFTFCLNAWRLELNVFLNIFIYLIDPTVPISVGHCGGTTHAKSLTRGHM